MVKASAGITDDDPVDDGAEKLRDCCEDEAVADLLGLASGVLEAVEGERGQQEIAWAARDVGRASSPTCSRSCSSSRTSTGPRSRCSS